MSHGDTETQRFSEVSLCLGVSVADFLRALGKLCVLSPVKSIKAAATNFCARIFR